MTITMAQAVTAYQIGNNGGVGYAPYTDTPGDDTIDEAVNCFETDGWKLVLTRSTSEEVAVLRSIDGELIAIGGDGVGRSAWAVPIVVDIHEESATSQSTREEHSNE
jgi:hypothetical protein